LQISLNFELEQQHWVVLLPLYSVP